MVRVCVYSRRLMAEWREVVVISMHSLGAVWSLVQGMWVVVVRTCVGNVYSRRLTAEWRRVVVINMHSSGAVWSMVQGM